MDFPKTKSHLIVETMDEEVLVYCSQAQKAYCLSPTCAAVFMLCDGTRSLAELTTSWSEQQVSESLATLQEHGLLQETAQPIRRDFLKAALAPLILAVAAPSPALAASVGAGTPCVSNIQCGFLAWTNTCRPCDVNNSMPPDCDIPNSFCMRTFRVNVDVNGDAIPGDTCLSDSHAFGFPDQCDFVNPGNIWATNCNDARAAVIAQGKPYSNYRCCSCF